MAGESTLAALIEILPQAQQMPDWSAVEAEIQSFVERYRTTTDKNRQLQIATAIRRILKKQAPDIHALLIEKMTELEQEQDSGIRRLPPHEELVARIEQLSRSDASSNSTSFLNARFDGYEQASRLPVSQWLPLVVWVGARGVAGALSASAPFAFQFPSETESVEFSVIVDGDPEVWEIRPAEDRLVVEPLPKAGMANSLRDATFLVRARQPGRHKLSIRVAQKATGTVVQDLWMYVVIGDGAPESSTDPALRTESREQHSAAPTGAADMAPPPPLSAIHSVSISQPLDLQRSAPHWVSLTFEALNVSAGGFPLRVDASLPEGRTSNARYTIPVSERELQDATTRLRRELEKIVNYFQPDADECFPFSSKTTLTINEAIMRKVAVALADAGRQIWDMLFNTGKASSELKNIAKRLRDLEPGTVVEIHLENPKFCLPWALLYDKPGKITAESLDWSGFWGHRFDLRTLYPGDYPSPVMRGDTMRALMAFCDDDELAGWIAEQQSVLCDSLGEQCCTVTIGADAFLDTLQQNPELHLVYTLCYGHCATQPGKPLALPGEATIFFSQDTPTRVADLRRLELEPFVGRPLIFMNSCEGASRDPAHHDDFVSYFIEDQRARGCIGTEVIVPKYLAHRFALDFLEAFAKGHAIGPTMWRLRREYLDKYNNILAFNYALYGNGDTRLTEQLAARDKPE